MLHIKTGEKLAEKVLLYNTTYSAQLSHSISFHNSINFLGKLLQANLMPFTKQKIDLCFTEITWHTNIGTH